MGNRNSALDGIRAIGITLIVMSHTGLLSQGAIGNAIFFCLSGFFASNPFGNSSESKYLNFKHCYNYWTSRILRIFPVYYVVILAFYLLGSNFFSGTINFLKNCIFFESNSHLWFLQQELLMYFCVPIIFIIISFIKKILDFKYIDEICALIIVLASWLAYTKLSIEVFFLIGNGKPQKFRVEQFLVGFALGYFWKALNKKRIKLNKLVKLVCDFVVIVFLVFSIVSSEQILSTIDCKFRGYYIGWEKPMLCSILSATMILCVLLNSESVISKLLGCKLVAYIGKISFGIYLVHVFFIPYLKLESEIKTFIFVYLISICVASMLYVLIEKPSILYAKTRKLKDIVDYYSAL